MIIELQNKLELFKRIFPNEKIVTVKQMEGAENYILEINNLWICKIPKNIHSNNLAIEAQLLNLLKNKLKTRIPLIEYYEPNFLVYKKISGTELTFEHYIALSPEQKDTLASDIAYFLYELHNSLPIETAKKLGLTQTNWPWPPEMLEAESTYLKDPTLIYIFNPCIQEYKDLRQTNVEVKLIHNDMILRNIIINEQTGKLSGIIDFTDVAFDDLYLDLRRNYLSIPKLSEAIAKQYAQHANMILNIRKIYIYYIATEFSRYLQHIKEQKEDLDTIKLRIVETFKFLQ